jgi:MFS family permease
MGLVYACFMLVGAAIVRLPAPGWMPEGFVPSTQPKKLVTSNDVYVYQALKTPQFWLIWIVLCMNVTAGIGVLGQASAMSQEMFPGRVTAAAAGGFVGLLSIFNMAGRFFWASMSDHIGRKNTYFIFFALGFILYALVPYFGNAGNLALFVLCFGVILSMYGGGFATVPAYLADIFGTSFVGAIHGRLLTAWSAAGVVGPLVIGYIRDAQISAGVERALVYDRTLYILAGFLAVGFVCNALVRPVAAKWLMTPEEMARLQASANADAAAPRSQGIGVSGGFDLKILLAWAAVCIPLAWGVWKTLDSAVKIFQ